MEVGIDSFASVGTSENGETADAAQSVAELLERIEQTDRSGLDIFGIDRQLTDLVIDIKQASLQSRE